MLFPASLLTSTEKKTKSKQEKPGIERVQALVDISRSRYVAIATQPVHGLQIRPIVHKQGAPLSFPQVTFESVL